MDAPRSKQVLEQSLRLLVEASEIFAESLDAGAMLGELATLLVPRLADGCIIDVVDLDGEVRRVASVVSDPAKQPIADALKHLGAPRPDAPHGVFGLLDRGDAVLIPEFDAEAAAAGARDPEHLRLMVALAPTSGIVVPMRARGRPVGLLWLCSLGERRFGPADLLLAQELGRRAALAADNVRLLEGERRATAAAQEASRLKDEFLGVVSHELRTPLTAILGWAKILLERDPIEETRRRGLAIIERNARAQARIIDDVLDVSRIVAGKLRLDPRPVALEGVIDAALDVLAGTAEAKGIALARQVDAPGAVVLGDPERLQQVFWNLLSNAIKFTPKKGKVEIALACDGTDHVVTVTDTGRGIDPRFLPFVFERFRQEDGSSRRDHGGLGLGLAIARQLVELHAGTISAASDGLGCGATFTVRLPSDVASAPSPSPPHATIVPPTDRSPTGDVALAGLRVLVVDDEAEARELVRIALEEQRAIVIEASSAAEGMARLAADRPALVVADIGMPGEDGYAFVARIRALPPPLGALPVVALTAYAAPDDAIRARDAGFSLHLKKPIESAALVAALAALLGRTP